MEEDKLVLVAEFGRAVGLRGELRLKSHTADPEAVADYNPLTGSNGQAYTIEAARPVPGTTDMLIVRVRGVTRRDQAEALNRVTLSVPRSRLPAPEDEDEFLQADLIGLAVVGTDGAALGTIVSVQNFGAGDILEIRPPRGPTALVPFRDPFVPEVDIAAGRVILSDAGLLAPSEPGPPSGRGRSPRDRS